MTVVATAPVDDGERKTVGGAGKMSVWLERCDLRIAEWADPAVRFCVPPW